MNRKEHLEWCKSRALEYVDKGDLENALWSILSDLRKHEETKNHDGANLGMALLMAGNLSTSTEMREFIVGLN